MQQIFAGIHELNERVQNAEARATEAERRDKLTQHSRNLHDRKLE